MTDKNLFIYYDDLIKAKRISNVELSVIINLTNYKNLFTIKKKLEEIKNNLINKNIKLKNLFIISYYYKELLEYVEDLELYTYITFADEENYRVEISNLTDSQKEHIVGASPVSSGVGIVFYKTIGIKNLIIESPLLNDEQNLALLKDLGYNNLFAIPNKIEYYNTIDSNWIRPEAISIYKKSIPNYILVFDEFVNIDTVIAAYASEQWIGNIGDIVTNIDKESEFAKTTNLLSYAFDKRRMNCRANCHSCINCKRDLDYINRIKNLLIGDDK